MKKINCPICNSNSFKKIFTKDMLDSKYTLVKCKGCSLIFINPLPTDDELNRYYNTDYSVPEYQRKKVVMKGKKALSILKKLGLSKKSKIFELGASHGFFLNEVKKQGLMPYGVELSKKASENARKNFKLNIENNFFQNSKAYTKNDYFDVAVAFDVLEHLTNPNKILLGFNKILKKNGRVVLTIPNIDSTEFKFYGRHWEWLSPPAHLFFYSPSTIKKILLKNGFEIEYLETYRGDSAGNFLFNGFLSFQQLIFYNLKYLIGKKKLIEKRNRIRDSMNKSKSKKGEEFSGYNKLAFKFTEFINPIFAPLTNFRNNKGKGATILVIAKKK